MEEIGQYIWHHKLGVYVAVIVTASLLLEVGLGSALHNLVYR